MALVGKQCPSIGGLTVVKGDARLASLPARGRPMIVEFWASWCGPCRMAFPHLSGLARKFKDKGLAVVGVCMEDDVAATRRFVEQQGSNMDYTVVVDSRGEAADRLMGAAGVSGIPHAFVIDSQGRIAHHGHPLDPRFEQAVAQVCAAAAPARPAGDYKAADRAYVAEQRLKRFQQQQEQAGQQG